jgi:hypothetical protein
LKETGTCEDCEDYFHPDEEARNCIQCDMTGRDRDIWLKTGLCYTCPVKTYPGANKYVCETDDCDDVGVEAREFKKDDGTCHICEDYTYPDSESQTCKEDTCNEFQYKLKSGYCFQCEEGYQSWKNSTGEGCELIPVIPIPQPLPCPEDTEDESWGRDIDGNCIMCGLPYMKYNETTKECEEYYGIFGRKYPPYSYVYTYTNKTTTDNITYPEYDITTTKYTGDENYTEQLDGDCPCDLSEYDTGEKRMNEIIKTAVDSAVAQQAKADYDFYDPLLVDPESVPVVGEASE